MKKLPCYVIAVSLFISAASAGAVRKELVPAEQPQTTPGNCESNISTLSLAHQAANEGRLLFAIARLGDGEYKRELNRRRLHNVRVYLTEFDWKRDPKTLIIAEGERVKGYGRVELYVDGRLFDIIVVKPNGDLLVGSCEPDDIRPVRAERNLYPYRDRRLQRNSGSSSRQRGKQHQPCQ